MRRSTFVNQGLGINNVHRELKYAHSAATGVTERTIAPMQDVIPLMLHPRFWRPIPALNIRLLSTASWRQFSTAACIIRGGSHAPADRSTRCLVPREQRLATCWPLNPLMFSIRGSSFLHPCCSPAPAVSAFQVHYLIQNRRDLSTETTALITVKQFRFKIYNTELWVKAQAALVKTSPATSTERMF